MYLWARIKAGIKANPPVAVALIAVVTGIVFIPYRDYRWIGHGIIGLATLALVVVTVTLGATLAGRIRRTPNRNRFRLHRKHGIAAGLLLVIALTYGLWMIIADQVRPLNSFHGLGALMVATMLEVQVATGLSPRRFRTKSVHRRVGYVVLALIIAQVTLGVISSPLVSGAGQYPRYTMRWLTLLDETWRPDGVIGPREYFFTRVLDEGNYEVSYRTDGEYINVGLKVKTTGWVGIGISAGDAMANAEIIFAFVRDDGTVVVEDHFGVSRGHHVPDVELGGTDDIIAFGGREEGGQTIIEFRRPIAPVDKFDIPLVEGMQTLIWAYGEDDSPKMHVSQGYLDVRLR